MVIKWTRLTEHNVPDEEALAIGYQNEMLIGYISSDEDVEFICEGEGVELTEVSHFILKKDLLKLVPGLTG